MENLNDIIEDILKKKDSKESYKTKYDEFSKRYPTLFEKLFDENFDEKTLKYMLNQNEQINTNIQTEHTGSVKVGTMLVDKYVKPNLV